MLSVDAVSIELPLSLQESNVSREIASKLLRFQPLAVRNSGISRLRDEIFESGLFKAASPLMYGILLRNVSQQARLDALLRQVPDANASLGYGHSAAAV